MQVRKKFKENCNDTAHSIPPVDTAVEALGTVVTISSPHFEISRRIFAVVYGMTEDELQEKLMTASPL